jgi:hypothetical protein
VPTPAAAVPEAVQHPSVLRSTAAGRIIYLAQTTDDLDEEREQVRRYVEQYGIRVVPENLYPQGGSEFVAAVDADLERADAFVQLFGSRPTRRPPDLPLGYDRAQFERAVGRGMPIVQWLRPDIDPRNVSDPQHAALLSGENVMRIGLEAFKADVVRRLEKPPEPVSLVSAAGPEQFVFINADGSDIQLAEALRKEFTSAQVSAAVPILQGSSEDVRLDLEENIVECDALVMVYGAATPVWVRGQLRLYSKLKHRRKEPLKALAIYLGPPEAKPDIGMDMPEVKKIDYREGAAAESVRQFLAGMRQ